MVSVTKPTSSFNPASSSTSSSSSSSSTSSTPSSTTKRRSLFGNLSKKRQSADYSIPYSTHSQTVASAQPPVPPRTHTSTSTPVQSQSQSQSQPQQHQQSPRRVSTRITSSKKLNTNHNNAIVANSNSTTAKTNTARQDGNRVSDRVQVAQNRAFSSSSSSSSSSSPSAVVTDPRVTSPTRSSRIQYYQEEKIINQEPSSSSSGDSFPRTFGTSSAEWDSMQYVLDRVDNGEMIRSNDTSSSGTNQNGYRSSAYRYPDLAGDDEEEDEDQENENQQYGDEADTTLDSSTPSSSPHFPTGRASLDLVVHDPASTAPFEGIQPRQRQDSAPQLRLGSPTSTSTASTTPTLAASSVRAGTNGASSAAANIHTRHRSHFSIPDVVVTTAEEEGETQHFEVKVPAAKRRSFILNVRNPMTLAEVQAQGQEQDRAQIGGNANGNGMVNAFNKKKFKGQNKLKPLIRLDSPGPTPAPSTSIPSSVSAFSSSSSIAKDDWVDGAGSGIQKGSGNPRQASKASVDSTPAISKSSKKGRKTFSLFGRKSAVAAAPNQPSSPTLPSSPTTNENESDNFYQSKNSYDSSGSLQTTTSGGDSSKESLGLKNGRDLVMSSSSPTTIASSNFEDAESDLGAQKRSIIGSDNTFPNPPSPNPSIGSYISSTSSSSSSACQPSPHGTSVRSSASATNAKKLSRKEQKSREKKELELIKQVEKVDKMVRLHDEKERKREKKEEERQRKLKTKISLADKSESIASMRATQCEKKPSSKMKKRLTIFSVSRGNGPVAVNQQVQLSSSSAGAALDRRVSSTKRRNPPSKRPSKGSTSSIPSRNGSRNGSRSSSISTNAGSTNPKIAFNAITVQEISQQILKQKIEKKKAAAATATVGRGGTVQVRYENGVHQQRGREVRADFEFPPKKGAATAAAAADRDRNRPPRSTPPPQLTFRNEIDEPQVIRTYNNQQQQQQQAPPTIVLTSPSSPVRTSFSENYPQPSDLPASPTKNRHPNPNSPQLDSTLYQTMEESRTSTSSDWQDLNSPTETRFIIPEINIRNPDWIPTESENQSISSPSTETVASIGSIGLERGSSLRRALVMTHAEQELRGRKGSLRRKQSGNAGKRIGNSLASARKMWNNEDEEEDRDWEEDDVAVDHHDDDDDEQKENQDVFASRAIGGREGRRNDQSIGGQITPKAKLQDSIQKSKFEPGSDSGSQSQSVTPQGRNSPSSNPIVLPTLSFSRPFGKQTFSVSEDSSEYEYDSMTTTTKLATTTTNKHSALSEYTNVHHEQRQQQQSSPTIKSPTSSTTSSTSEMARNKEGKDSIDANSTTSTFNTESHKEGSDGQQ